MTELEVLKPAVQAKLQKLHYEKVYQLHKQNSSMQRETQESSIEWPAIRPKWNDYSTKQVNVTHSRLTLSQWDIYLLVVIGLEAETIFFKGARRKAQRVSMTKAGDALVESLGSPRL